MTNTSAYDNTYAQEEERDSYYTRIEAYLERLEGKAVCKELKERTLPEYYALVASLAA